MDKGLEFMLEGALNKDMEASSITCRLMADDGSSEEKYYLRHDEAKVRTLAPPSPHQFNPACRLACFLPLAWRPPEHVSLQWRKPTCLTV